MKWWVLARACAPVVHSIRGYPHLTLDVDEVVVDVKLGTMGGLVSDASRRKPKQRAHAGCSVKTHLRLVLRIPGKGALGMHAQRLVDESFGQLNVAPAQLKETASPRNALLQSDRAAVDAFVEVENRGSDERRIESPCKGRQRRHPMTDATVRVHVEAKAEKLAHGQLKWVHRGRIPR